MIAKMNKFTFLIYHKDYDMFLEKLRELGVVHVEIRQSGELHESLHPLMQRYSSYKGLLKDMVSCASKFVWNDLKVEQNTPIESVIDSYNSYNNILQSHISSLSALEKEIKALEPWGNFDWTKIDALEKDGWNVRFYCCQEKSFDNEWIEEYNAIVIYKKEGQCYFITINNGCDAKIDAEQIHLPHQNYDSLVIAKQEEEKQIEKARLDLSRYAAENIPSVERAIDMLQDDIDLVKVRLGGEPKAEGALVLLEGWAPEENSSSVKEMLEQRDVYYEMHAAGKEDNAPIKLKNNPITRCFEILTKMYGMPDYGEFDPTPMLAPFYALFFGLCLGDAGYGLFLVLLGLFLKKKVSKSMHGIMNLLITLGGAATLVGALVGTFFGVDLTSLDIPQGLKDIMITGKFGDLEYDKTMIFALIVGMVHICFAMLVKAICSTVRYGFTNSLSDWGWLLFVCGSVCTGTLYYLQIISVDVLQMAILVIGCIAAIGIYLLNNIHRNVFVNVGAGLWDTYNMATGLMGDLLSYLRLYALGLAGGMLGSVFNRLGMQLHDLLSDVLWGIPGWIAFGLIFVCGHALNIALSCLSAYVHSIRLTFVEYFKNSGYDGKGVMYKPFSSVQNKK